MSTTPLRRLIATGASIAVATVGLAAFAPAANAASTSLKFNCSASILTNQEFIFNADLTVPAEVEVGSTIETTFTGSVTVPNSTRGAAYALLGGRFLEGVATINGKFGAAPITLEANLPKAAIPSADGPFSLATTGGGSFVASTVGAQNITIDGFSAPLKMEKADGTTSDVAVTCTAKSPDTVVATVKVVPVGELTTEPTPDPEVKPNPIKAAKTKTTVKAKHSKKTKKATVRVKVTKGKKKAATGKVKIVVKKGKKTVTKKTVKLKKGSAKVTFKKKLRTKGKYTVTVKYLGTKTQKKSSKKVNFRIK